MSVCDSQSDFNEAFDQALKYVQSKYQLPMWAMIIFVVIYLGLTIWAIVLALGQPSDVRVIHVILAIIFGPIYVIAYYISK